MRTVSILGSTGSIGRNTLDLVTANPGLYRVEALTAHNNVELLVQQARACNARKAVIGNASLYGELKSALAGTGIEAAAGEGAVVEAAAAPADWTMSAIVGIAGLRPTLAAIGRGHTVALANKESLVCAGRLMLDAVTRHGATLLPVDSEHNAVFQLFDPSERPHVRRIILTASGGPFLRRPLEELASVTPEEAQRHPTWAMGAKISVDSATMMNKALEVIEAMYLFDLPMSQIEVRIHPQSIVHALVEYEDGSILAHMGASDMRTPIAHTLAWPQRMPTTGKRLDLTQNVNLSFENADNKRFEALNIVRAVEVDETGLAIAINAANEVAVAQFLAGQRRFDQIIPLVAQVAGHWAAVAPGGPPASLEDVMAYDAIARALAEAG